MIKKKLFYIYTHIKLLVFNFFFSFFLLVCLKEGYEEVKDYSTYSSSAPPFSNLYLTSSHNLPLLYVFQNLLIPTSNVVWKTNAPKKMVPTNTEFLLNTSLYRDWKDCLTRIDKLSLI